MLGDDASIRLLFSDVCMPLGIDGVEFARVAKRQSQGIKVLLTSGYADDVQARPRAFSELVESGGIPKTWQI
jgi:CheY-like chemotaxis protein